MNMTTQSLDAAICRECRNPDSPGATDVYLCFDCDARSQDEPPVTMSPSRSRADEISHEAAVRLGRGIRHAHDRLTRSTRRIHRIGMGLEGWGRRCCWGYTPTGRACDCCPF